MCICIESFSESIVADLQTTVDENNIVHINQFRTCRKKAISFLIQSLRVCIASNRKRAGSHYRHIDVLLYISGIITHYF
jgi:hypothetical protein